MKKVVILHGTRIKALALTVLLFAVSNPAWADIFVVTVANRAKKTVLVSPKGTETASGTALLAALAKITDASASNPYLILIEPGVYDIQGLTLVMKSYVDIQGSGENVTKITGYEGDPESGVLEGADNAELRFLTVENTGEEGTSANAIYNDYTSPCISNVTTLSSGADFCRGVLNKGGIQS